jgi:hypothetical protein
LTLGNTLPVLDPGGGHRLTGGRQNKPSAHSTWIDCFTIIAVASG